MQHGIDIAKKRVIMRIKHRGKVGIGMKCAIRSAMSVSRPAMSFNYAVRFTLAQLFFGIFGFTPMPI